MRVKSKIGDETELLARFGASVDYNYQDSYTKEMSHQGLGNYPPDWPERRKAIWWLQDNRCARCGDEDSDSGHVHHIKHLSIGGNNSLHNLVGLCVDCHALMHSDEELGNWREAPKFPISTAEDEVAVIKRGSHGSQEESEASFEHDLKKIATETNSEKNSHAVRSEAVYDTSANAATMLGHFSTKSELDSGLSMLLIQNGRVPENKHHMTRRLEIDTPYRGFVKTFFYHRPDIEVEPLERPESSPFEQVATERVDQDESGKEVVLLTESVSEATVKVTEVRKEPATEQVYFEDSRTKSVYMPGSLSFRLGRSLLILGLILLLFGIGMSI